MFCVDYPMECRPDADARKGPLSLDSALAATVARINTDTNMAIVPASDQQLYGVEERWAFPVDSGDCEDIALEKRRRLHDIAGIAYSNLLMTVVRKQNGEGHAVLTLRTTSGDFVLDNLDWAVKPWIDTPYTYIKRQDSRDPGRWDEIHDGQVLVVGAVAK